MAERRMFAKSIVMSDSFLDMPCSAQALYLQLGVRADDDGFVNSPRVAVRTIGASMEDLELLIQKRFLLSFDSGVVLIKHWRINNQIRKDRYCGTQYSDELRTVAIKSNGAYTEVENVQVNTHDNLMTTSWQPQVNHGLTQYSIGKLSKDYILPSNISTVVTGDNVENSANVENSVTGRPILSEVKTYFKAEKLLGNPEKFFAHYDSIGWIVGGSVVTNWHSLARKWSINYAENNPVEHELSIEEVERQIDDIDSQIAELKDVPPVKKNSATMTPEQFKLESLRRSRAVLTEKLKDMKLDGL